MLNITSPSSEQVKHAMLCKFPVEYDGIRYERIVGYAMRIRFIAGRDVPVMEAELLDKNGTSISVVNPKKITILNYLE